MDVRYNLTSKEMRQFSAFVNARRSSGTVRIIRILVPVLVLLALAYTLTSQPQHRHYYTTPASAASQNNAMVVAVAAPLLTVGIFLMLMTIYSGLNAPSKEPITISITPHHFIVDGRGMRSERPWSKILDVAQDKNNIYVLLAKDVGHIVPKRAFADAASADAFFEMASGYKATALNTDEVRIPEADAVMLISHTVTAKDATQAHWYWLRRYGRKRVVTTWGLVLVMMVIAVSVSLLPIVMSGHSVGPDSLLGCFPILLFPIVAPWLLLSPRGTIANLTDRDNPQATTAVSLSGDGVEIQSPTFDRRLAWEDIADVTRDRALVYFSTSKDIAWIIPISAFASPDEATAFVDKANALRRGEAVHVETGQSWPPAPLQ